MESRTRPSSQSIFFNNHKNSCQSQCLTKPKDISEKKSPYRPNLPPQNHAEQASEIIETDNFIDRSTINICKIH